MPRYEVDWQVFGTRYVDADDALDAKQQVDEWLEDEHGLTGQVADGWDYEARELAPSPGNGGSR
jgi:hypothetical protein